MTYYQSDAQVIFSWFGYCLSGYEKESDLLFNALPYYQLNEHLVSGVLPHRENSWCDLQFSSFSLWVRSFHLRSIRILKMPRRHTGTASNTECSIQVSVFSNVGIKAQIFRYLILTRIMGIRCLHILVILGLSFLFSSADIFWQSA